ncbi:glycoside hydrolase family 2 TIM barrel-domain containing protein [Archangium violaceum]|uniref:glycoside hydrolase family 2 TIM barrel-domain containing protein n=1 Tax=Archangium violaceum TaxID=83451 RepID=UPI0036DA93C5
MLRGFVLGILMVAIQSCAVDPAGPNAPVVDGGSPRADGGVPDDGAISVEGRAIKVGGKAIQLKGVCWNPVGKGHQHPPGDDYAAFADQDIALMKAAGINVVRTYDTIRDTRVLDKLHAAGIRVIMSVYAYGGEPATRASEHVAALKNHPAILMWSLGNEWNYNGLYTGMSFNDSMVRLNQIAAAIKAIDKTHPIVTVYGEMPSRNTIEGMPDVDVWGLNMYRGITFGDAFDKWTALSQKPMFLAEYGADAFNAKLPGYDPKSQGTATRALTEELLEHSTANKGGVCSGGTIFEWSDEWWKSGNPSQHDNGGEAPGGGPYPDGTFNEEWWGIVDVDRNTRPAYEALKSLYAP